MNPYIIVSSEKILTSAIRLAGISVMARYIVPESFGYYSVVLVVITLSMVLVESGFGGALIRHPRPSEIDYSTTMIVNVILSILVICAIWTAAPYVANYYNYTDLVDVLRFSACVLFLRALTINIVVRLTRERRFTIQSIVNLFSLFVSMCGALWLAMKGFGLWALVIQQISEAFIILICLLCYDKTKIQYKFSKKSMLYLVDFGGKTTLASFIRNGHQSVVTLIVSTFFSVATLGHFAQASRLNGFYSGFITAVVDKISFADLSREYHRDNKRFMELSINGLWLISGIAFLIVAIVHFKSSSIVWHLLGEGWELAGSILKVVSLAGLALVVEAYFKVLLKSAGLASLILKSEIYKFVVGLVVLCIGAKLGFTYFLWSVVLAGMLNLIISGYLVSKFIGFGFIRQIVYMIPASFGGIISTYFVTYNEFHGRTGEFLTLFIEVVTLFGIYSFIFLFLSFGLYKIRRYHDQ